MTELLDIGVYPLRLSEENYQDDVGLHIVGSIPFQASDGLNLRYHGVHLLQNLNFF